MSDAGRTAADRHPLPDRLGRGAIAAFYRTPVLFPSFAALVFFESGITIALTALSTECFPTVLRATARAWVTNAGVVGAVLGLGLVGALSAAHGRSRGGRRPAGALPLVLVPLLGCCPRRSAASSTLPRSRRRDASGGDRRRRLRRAVRRPGAPQGARSR